MRSSLPKPRSIRGEALKRTAAKVFNEWLDEARHCYARTPIKSISTSVSLTSRPVQPMVVRGRRFEIALPDSVEAVEIVEIREENLRLDHLIER